MATDNLLKEKLAKHEMARDMCTRMGPCDFCPVLQHCEAKNYAARAYDAGYRMQKFGHWICKYNKEEGTTDVTCSKCLDTREIKGCFVDIHNNPIYWEDDFCPHCGADMTGKGGAS